MPDPLPYPYETPLDLSDSTKWTLRHSATYQAVGGEYYFDPIPEQAIAVNFTSPILAIQVVTTVSGDVSYVGTLRQVQSIGISGTIPAVLTGRSIYLGTRVIFLRQDVTGSYQLRFRPYSKLSNVSVLIWEFL